MLLNKIIENEDVKDNVPSVGQPKLKEEFKPNSNRTLDVIYISLFVGILAICSWISVPMTIPLTMQTFGVFLVLGMLGGKRGTIAIIAYVMLGIVGAPVFSNFTGGLGILLGNTGGYIVGFILSGITYWIIEKVFGKSMFVSIVSMVLGLIVCYAFGTIWFMTLYLKKVGEIALVTALTWCVFPYVAPDLIKIGLAVALSKKLAPQIKQIGKQI